eukprot:scaffold10831_cov129-Isochrysis_galbana.AAC.2
MEAWGLPRVERRGRKERGEEEWASGGAAGECREGRRLVATGGDQGRVRGRIRHTARLVLSQVLTTAQQQIPGSRGGVKIPWHGPEARAVPCRGRPLFAHHGVLRLGKAIGTTQVRHEDHGLGAAVEAVLDGRHCAVDARRVGDDRRVLLVLGHVEIHTDQHTLALDVNILDRDSTAGAAGRVGERLRGLSHARRPVPCVPAWPLRGGHAGG